MGQRENAPSAHPGPGGRAVAMFTDVEALLIRWLSEQLERVHVVATLPAGLERRLPVVQIQRVGGRAETYPWSPSGPLHDRAAVDIDCYAATREQASDLAGQCAQVVPAIRGLPLSTAVCTAVLENTAPTWRPDYNPQVARVGATYECTFRPA